MRRGSEFGAQDTIAVMAAAPFLRLSLHVYPVSLASPIPILRLRAPRLSAEPHVEDWVVIRMALRLRGVQVMITGGTWSKYNIGASAKATAWASGSADADSAHGGYWGAGHVHCWDDICPQQTSIAWCAIRTWSVWLWRNGEIVKRRQIMEVGWSVGVGC